MQIKWTHECQWIKTQLYIKIKSWGNKWKNGIKLKRKKEDNYRWISQIHTEEYKVMDNMIEKDPQITTQKKHLLNKFFKNGLKMATFLKPWHDI